MNLADSMVRAKVIDYDLQQKLKKEMSAMKPRPAIYDPDFIAANQVRCILVPTYKEILFMFYWLVTLFYLITLFFDR